MERRDAKRPRRSDRPPLPDNLPPPGPPKGVALDPRAGKGPTSYHDFDSVAPAGDLELDY
jgi:hypothetical protein